MASFHSAQEAVSISAARQPPRTPAQPKLPWHHAIDLRKVSMNLTLCAGYFTDELESDMSLKQFEMEARGFDYCAASGGPSKWHGAVAAVAG